ncbi:MAG: RNA polymerase subunit sigma [Blastopirellula sp.]|nr:RNA polymerase subunit sigma [Blastopirellula sp.]
MNTTHESDEWLMGQVAAGDRDCLETLMRRYASPLLTFLHRMLGDRHRAEELFQEVFLAVWTKRKTYKLPRAFRFWLYAIAANRCRADFRKAKLPSVGGASPGGADAVSAESEPADVAVAGETADIVDVAVKRLPTNQRTVVVLRIWNQLSFAEIASTMSLQEGTVRSHMHHGLASLRRSLEPQLKVLES